MIWRLFLALIVFIVTTTILILDFAGTGFQSLVYKPSAILGSVKRFPNYVDGYRRCLGVLKSGLEGIDA